MKFITAILVIFCACSLSTAVADNGEVLPLNILGDLVSDIDDTVSDVVSEIIPDCIFGVKSVSMVLFTRNIPYGKNISLDDVCNDFDLTKPIIFLVHGFISNANYTISYELSKALIKKDFTVFSLDWSDAACTNGLPLVKFLGYPSAVQNTREIGDLLASYVESLIDKCGASLKNMTFIGHSLGAHVCGFASKNIQKSGYGLVPLLIGADPASPLFNFNKCNNRFCDTDAENVIALHTSSLGIRDPIGHVDLYFNGGLIQPKCLIVDVACSHSRSVQYLVDIVEHECRFPGIPASYSAILSPFSKYPYPQSNTTDCIVMDGSIFDKNEGSRTNLADGTYYMFVNSSTFCTQESFNCLYRL